MTLSGSNELRRIGTELLPRPLPLGWAMNGIKLDGKEVREYRERSKSSFLGWGKIEKRSYGGKGFGDVTG